MRREISPVETPAPGVLRLIALAMAAALFALVAIALVVRPVATGALPPFVAWTIGGLAAGSLLVGILLAVTADAASSGYRVRLLVSLALRETGGLLGAIATLLGGEPAWALGLGGAAIVALLALLPAAESPR